MAFTLSTNLPVDFLGCKALTIELFSLLRSVVPGSPEYMTAQFDLRVMRYRLARHHCKKSWDAETTLFIRSFEFAFPQLIIDVPEKSLRHMTCGCTEDATIDNHRDELAACRHLLEAAEPAKSVQYDINDYVAEQGETGAEPSVEQQSHITEPLDRVEEDELKIQEDGNHPTEVDEDEEVDPRESTEDDGDLQFGDIVIAEFETTPGPWSIPKSENSKDLLDTINNRERRQDIVTAVANDTLAALLAEEEIGRRDHYPSSHVISEIVISSVDRGIQYEIRSTNHDVILAYHEKPNAEELFNDVVNLGLSNIQAWKAYLLWSRFAGRPQTDAVDLSLVNLALINTPMDGVERFLL